MPKFLPNAEGGVGERNGVSCGSIEHKMGIHGNATCVMNFDGATGYLIGPANKGLNCMFTFMNTARLGTALQGLAHAEVAFQGGLKYARERLQMRSLTGPKAPDKAADPIIVHPDVRRMLLTMKAFAEGNRAMVYFTAKQVDIVKYSQDEEARKKADALLAFLTPIAQGVHDRSRFRSAANGVTNSWTASLPSWAWQNLWTILVKPLSASPWVISTLRPSRSRAWPTPKWLSRVA